MNTKLETDKVPAGYIGIGVAAGILKMDAVDLRGLMLKGEVSSNSRHRTAFEFMTCSTPNRLLWVSERDVYRFKKGDRDIREIIEGYYRMISYPEVLSTGDK
jgi:hypothetical protein